jgi:hypothetical protein
MPNSCTQGSKANPGLKLANTFGVNLSGKQKLSVCYTENTFLLCQICGWIRVVGLTTTGRLLAFVFFLTLNL